ncbi:ricin-type beta-trefoil lectin domain protein [Streptomyces sp. BRA346]
MLLVAVPAGPAQAAPLRSTPLITYNMLGADSGSDTKWTTTVGRYARSAEIVAIQEAGPTPPGEFVDNSANIAGLPAIGRGNFIQHHRWRFGHESYEVYFLQTDPNRGTYVGNRNNVALLTQREADEVTAIPNPHRNGRAMVGVRFDDDWYFSYHALSGNETTGGRDARDMLARVDAFVSQQPGRQWTVMGDFNREPTDLVIPAGSRVYSTGQPTQVGGRELDFAVSSADIPNHPRERQPGATADHFAAAVGPLRTPTEPRRLFSSSRYIESMQTGTVLAPTAAPWSGEWLETQRRDPEDASQRFDIEFDDNAGLRIREPGGECATVSTLEPHTLSLRDCSNSLSHQRFEFVSLGNDQYQIRSVRTGQCVEQGSSETSFVRMRRCADVDGQHWTLPQQHQDLNEPNFETGDLPVAYTGSEGLQNLYTGQMLTGEPRGLPTTTVRAEQRHTAPTPTGAEWSMEWRGEYLRLRDPVTRECVELGDPPPFSDSPAGVDLNPCTDSSAQLWKVDPYAGKAFRLQSRQAEDTPGGVCLSLSGDNELGDRLDIVQATRCDSPLGSQIWSFAPYSTATDQPPPTP